MFDVNAMSMHFQTQGLTVFGRMWISVMCWLVLGHQPVDTHQYTNIKVTFDPEKVTEGMNVTLKCETDSSPPAHKFTWMREKHNSHKQSLNQYGQNITIPQVQVEDSGWYDCTATNTKGSESSIKNYLRVLCGGGVESSVSYGAKVLHVVKGAQAMLPCTFCFYRFTKSSRVEGYWLLNNSRELTNTVYRSLDDYQPDSNYRGRVSLAGDLTERNCSLLIEDVRLSDAKIYYFHTIVDDTPMYGEMGIELKIIASDSRKWICLTALAAPVVAWGAVGLCFLYLMKKKALAVTQIENEEDQYYDDVVLQDDSG